MLEPEKPTPDAPAAASPVRDPARPPRIDSVNFARKRELLQGRSALSSMSRLLTAGVAPEGSLDWQVEGSVSRDEMQRVREFLQVRTAFSPWMTCSKCLEPVQVRDLKTHTLFRLAATEDQAAVEDRESDALEVIPADPALDLAALVEDEAILALPMAPAHPDCGWHKGTGSDNAGDV
jgi:uncharacterized protein